MGSLNEQLGTNGQAFTLTLASLTNGSARESTVVDNTSNLFLDIAVQVKVKSGGSGTSSSGYVNVYIYGTADNGTTYPDNVTGSDAAITLVSPPNVRLLGSFNVVANSTTYKSNVFSVAQALGFVPAKWGIIVENRSGGTLDSTEGNHSYKYQGIYGQY